MKLIKYNEIENNYEEGFADFLKDSVSSREENENVKVNYILNLEDAGCGCNNIESDFNSLTLSDNEIKKIVEENGYYKFELTCGWRKGTVTPKILKELKDYINK